MLERYLIEHCSPTLASLKTANLFTMEYTDKHALKQMLQQWNACFLPKGITLLLLRTQNGRALVYVCRKGRLQRDLSQPAVQQFLRQYGYTDTRVDAALCTLKKRLAQAEGFPHEIGIFLGYPLGDVVGFIQNAGKNAKCCGCWKVYCNECEAMKTFARYKKCTDVYLRLWLAGRSVQQLTVAA